MSNLAVFTLAGSILVSAAILSWSHANAAGNDFIGIAAGEKGVLYELRQSGQICKLTVEDNGSRLLFKGLSSCS